MRIVLTALILAALGGAAWAAPKLQPAGVITTVVGKVKLYTAAKTEGPKTVSLNQVVYVGDRIKTGANGRVSLVLTDGTQLKMNYNSEITLKDKNSKGRTSARGIAAIQIFVGDLWAKVTKKDSQLEFDTPAAVAAVKGTEPTFSVQPDGSTCVMLASGKVALSNELPGGATLEPNEMICVAPHQAITQAMVHAWEQAGTIVPWTSSFGQASSASVVVTYKNQSGQTETLNLNFDASVTGTAQGATGTAGSN